jgi:hypothetical protein
MEGLEGRGGFGGWGRQAQGGGGGPQWRAHVQRSRTARRSPAPSAQLQAARRAPHLEAPLALEAGAQGIGGAARRARRAARAQQRQRRGGPWPGGGPAGRLGHAAACLAAQHRGRLSLWRSDERSAVAFLRLPITPTNYAGVLDCVWSPSVCCRTMRPRAAAPFRQRPPVRPPARPRACKRAPAARRPTACSRRFSLPSPRDGPLLSRPRTLAAATLARRDGTYKQQALWSTPGQTGGPATSVQLDPGKCIGRPWPATRPASGRPGARCRGAERDARRVLELSRAGRGGWWPPPPSDEMGRAAPRRGWTAAGSGDQAGSNPVGRGSEEGREWRGPESRARVGARGGRAPGG